jgi:hypothetical protein
MTTAFHLGLMISIQAQWFIAFASTTSVLLALGLTFGLKEWIFGPRLRLLYRHEANLDETSDCVVTERIDADQTAAFVRLRIDNQGRSTARRVAVRVIRVHYWDASRARWLGARPELDGRTLQPSNQLPDEPDTVDVFPKSDRIVDLASVNFGVDDGCPSPIFVEIGRPWPPRKANALGPGIWRLELLVCGDNFSALRYRVTLAFDGDWTDLDTPEIWDHFRIDGPSRDAILVPPSGVFDGTFVDQVLPETALSATRPPDS